MAEYVENVVSNVFFHYSQLAVRHPPENSEWTFPRESTWFFLLLFLKTVIPLHFSVYARKYAFSTSLVFAFSGRLIVLLTPLSVYFWNAACILTCHSGEIS